MGARKKWALFGLLRSRRGQPGGAWTLDSGGRAVRGMWDVPYRVYIHTVQVATRITRCGMDSETACNLPIFRSHRPHGKPSAKSPLDLGGPTRIVGRGSTYPNRKKASLWANKHLDRAGRQNTIAAPRKAKVASTIRLTHYTTGPKANHTRHRSTFIKVSNIPGLS